MAKTVCASLPTETLQHIVESLDGNAEALISCCLASQTLRAISQASLFRFVDLGPIEEERVHAFLTAIPASPHLAKYVTTFGFGSHEVFNPEFTRLFPLLRNVRSLKITSDWTNWRVIPSPVIQGLQDHILPDLERITIEGFFEIPLSVLWRACPRLTYLTLSRCNTLEGDDPPDMDQLHVPHPLRSLTLEVYEPGDVAMTTSLMTFLSRAQTRLEFLVLNGDPFEDRLLDIAVPLLKQVGSCLLYLYFGEDFSNHLISAYPSLLIQDEGFTFANVPQLRTFHIAIPLVGRDSGTIAPTLSFLSILLRRCPAHPLQAFVFVFHPPSDLPSDGHGAAGWYEFDAVLQDRDVLPQFKSLTIDYHEDFAQYDVRRFQDDFPWRLPLTASAGMISF